MAISVNAGGRLDRLPIALPPPDILAGRCRHAARRLRPLCLHQRASGHGSERFSTALQNADFISKTFLGMTIGALVTGFLGDHYGRRYLQINLLIFGLSSLAAPLRPT